MPWLKPYWNKKKISLLPDQLHKEIHKKLQYFIESGFFDFCQLLTQFKAFF